MKLYRGAGKQVRKGEAAVLGKNDMEDNLSQETADRLNPWAVKPANTEPNMSLKVSDSIDNYGNPMHCRGKVFHSSFINSSTKEYVDNLNSKSYMQFGNTLSNKSPYARNSNFNAMFASGDDTKPTKDTDLINESTHSTTKHGTKPDKTLQTLHWKSLLNGVEIKHRTKINENINSSLAEKEVKHDCKYEKSILEKHSFYKEHTDTPISLAFPREEKPTKEFDKQKKHKKTKRERNLKMCNITAVDSDCKNAEQLFCEESNKMDEKDFEVSKFLDGSQIYEKHEGGILKSRKREHDLVPICLSNGKLPQVRSNSSGQDGENEKLTYNSVNCKSAIRHSLEQLEDSIAASGDLGNKYLLKIACIEAENCKMANLLEQEQKKYKNIFELYTAQSEILAVSAPSTNDMKNCSCGAVYTVHDLEQALFQTNVHIRWLKAELEKLELRAKTLECALIRREAEYDTLREEHLRIKISMNKKVRKLLKTANDLKTITEALLYALKEKSDQLNEVANNKKGSSKDTEHAQLIKEVTKNEHLTNENILLKKQVVELKLNLGECRKNNQINVEISPTDVAKEE